MKTTVPGRDDLLGMRGYKAGAQAPGSIRLNANEVPDRDDGVRFSTPLNRYPEVHPRRLRQRMADTFSVDAENLLVTRGSSEAIDVLVRTYCRAYRHSILTMPPTFEMYGFYAAVQGAELIEVALDADNGFRVDFDAVAARCTDATRLIVICTPNNPTGSVVPITDILALAENRKGQSIVVVDEAYVEFSDAPSMTDIATSHDNLVVLRTLSKAQGLAGARCGAVVANAGVIELLGKVLPPYSFPTPVVDAVLGALTDARMAESKNAIEEIRRERDRLYDELANAAQVDKAWPSQGNFILVQFRDAERVCQHFRDAQILVRDYSHNALLKNCVRITIGSRNENDALLGAMSALGD